MNAWLSLVTLAPMYPPNALCPLQPGSGKLTTHTGADAIEALCVGDQCTLLSSLAGARKVLWHNMREEPVLYINGRPYVVREADKPFQNLEYTGITRSRVEDMEARLKRDVLDEARQSLVIKWVQVPHIT